ncbi:MAG TPA: insulinase family protein, partial [Byssovorax sp.]
PEETLNYVPQIHAFAIVAANRARFGLDGADLGQAPDLGELAVPAGTRLRTIARAAGVPTSTLRDLNPQLLKDRVPPTGGDYLVAVPAERVQRALATFPVYADQELVGQAEVEDMAPSVDAPGALPAFGDDPLPSRPRQLGKNRLPEITGVGGDPRGGGVLANLSVFDAKLPLMVVGSSSGWQRPGGDPMGLFAAASATARAKSMGGDAALEKELGFLREPTRLDDVPAITLSTGVVARIRRDASAALTAVSVRIGSTPVGQRGGPATNDLSSTMTVAPKDVDAAVELAAARVRLAFGDGADAEVASMRRRAAAPRRRALETAPYGKAWLALGDALFPDGSPLAGTVIGARDDAYTAKETLLVDAMAAERARAKASITIVGDVDEARAKQLLSAFLGGSRSAGAPIAPRTSAERISVDDDVPAPRLLFGFVCPGEGDAGDASARVLAELLDDPRVGRLARRLGVGQGAVTAAAAALDVGPRASVFAVDVAVQRGKEDEVEKTVGDELASLADDGPTGAEVGAAKVYVKLKLEKQRKAESEGSLPAGAPRSTPLPALRHALDPGRADRALKALDEVTPKTVQALAKSFLARERAVLVVTEPRDGAPRAAR